MVDLRLRELERRWASSGTFEDEVAYLLERVRTRDVSEDQLRLACYCEHEAALVVEQVYDLSQEVPEIELAQGVIAAAERAQDHTDPLVRRSARRAAQRAERALARARQAEPPPVGAWFAGLRRWGLSAMERAAIGVVRAAWAERDRIDPARRQEGDEALERKLEIADRLLVAPAEAETLLGYLPSPEDDPSQYLVRIGNLLMRVMCARSAAAARRDVQTSETRALEWVERDLRGLILPCIRSCYDGSEGQELATRGARDELLHWALGYPRRFGRDVGVARPRPEEPPVERFEVLTAQAGPFGIELSERTWGWGIVAVFTVLSLWLMEPRLPSETEVLLVVFSVTLIVVWANLE